MRLRKLSIWAIAFAVSLPAWAADRPGEISGFVRSSSGQPQIGAIVEIFGAAHRSFTVFTDTEGYYTATGLIPGFYSLRVSAPSFLPGLREKIGIRPGATVNVNVTLSTLLDVMQLGPVRPVSDDDDWKWTLRSAANRPILRIFNDPALTGDKPDHDLRGTLSFVAGSAAEGYGAGSDMSTGFTLEHSIFADGLLDFSGNVGYGEGSAAVLRAGYSDQLPNGSAPFMALTVRRFAESDPSLHNAALQALALSAGDDLAFGDILEVKLGSELQAIQFLGHVTAFRPYGSADIHLSPNAVLEYAFATSRPDELRDEKGFDSAPADLTEADPRVTMLDYAPKIEHAHHQELSLSQRSGKNRLQVAVFTDHVTDPALTGAGEVTSTGGFLLPDVSSGTFSFAGKTLDSTGLRIVFQRKVNSDLTATVDYAFGGVLDLARPDVSLQEAQSFLQTEHRHSVGAKFNATLPRTHTRCIASYRWVNGTALTPVDMFNASPGQSDPYFNLFIRQPIPTLGFLPSHLEAIIDLRNLLAQGYVPILAQDGQTVYLVQAARSLRGGLSFTF